MALAGRGESGPADGSNLKLAGFHGPLKVVEAGPYGPGLPAEVLQQFIIVNPQCQDSPDSCARPTHLTACLVVAWALKPLVVVAAGRRTSSTSPISSPRSQPCRPSKSTPRRCTLREL